MSSQRQGLAVLAGVAAGDGQHLLDVGIGDAQLLHEVLPHRQ